MVRIDMAQYQLDVRRLLCPLPVIRTQQKISDLQAGDELIVIATDPGVKHDIPTWCRLFQHDCLSIHEEKGEIYISIRVSGQRKTD